MRVPRLDVYTSYMAREAEMREEIKHYIIRLFSGMGIVEDGKVRHVDVEENPDGSVTVWLEANHGLVGLVIPPHWTPPDWH